MGWVWFFFYNWIFIPIQKSFFSIENWWFLYKAVNLVFLSHFKIIYYQFCSWSIQVEEKLCLQLLKPEHFILNKCWLTFECNWWCFSQKQNWSYSILKTIIITIYQTFFTKIFFKQPYKIKSSFTIFAQFTTPVSNFL